MRRKGDHVAMARAFENHGQKFTPDQIHVIGDKPRYIESENFRHPRHGCGKIFQRGNSPHTIQIF